MSIQVFARATPSYAGLLSAGRGLLLAPAAGVPALGHAGGVVGEGWLGREAGQVELVAVGAGLDGGPAAAVERGLHQRRIVEGAEHVAAEMPLADGTPPAFAVVEASIREIGLGP